MLLGRSTLKNSWSRRGQGRALRREDGRPPDRAQRNFADPDSRILPTRDGFVQGYNGQIAVDAASPMMPPIR